MIFIRICLDEPGMTSVRDSVRPEHRAYFAPNLVDGCGCALLQAGPLCADDTDGTMIGTFMVLKVPAIDQVRKFHGDDPFTQAGLFERVHIQRWDRHVG
jgi:hypothetical protein